MALSYVDRKEHLKTILNDVYPEIEGAYTKSKGFSVAFIFNNAFEESWKLMRVILSEVFGYSEDDVNMKGPRNIISFAYENNIIESDLWIKMLIDRNNTTQDYMSQNLEYYYNKVKDEYMHLVEDLVNKAESYASADN